MAQIILVHGINQQQKSAVLADIDTGHGDCGIELVGHGVLLFFGPPCQLRLLAGPEHGRTSAARLAATPAGESPANRGKPGPRLDPTRLSLADMGSACLLPGLRERKVLCYRPKLIAVGR